MTQTLAFLQNWPQLTDLLAFLATLAIPSFYPTRVLILVSPCSYSVLLFFLFTLLHVAAPISP